MSERIYTSNEYKRLGERIRSNPLNISEDDYLALQELRLTYKEPLAIVFNAINRAAYKVDPNCICTYRIKRIESIVSKLIRFPHMQVNKAEDIAGCRCIMTNTENVYKLFDKLQKIMDRLSFEITAVVHDYIEKPKDSGYRSIHLNVRLKGDKRVVEIQLRALEHHNWATLVEITDLLFRTKLKELGTKSDADLFEFHRLLSLPEKQLSKKDKYFIADTIIKYNYIEKIGEVFARNYLDVRRQWNKMRLQRNHFFLISTGSDGIPDFMGFNVFEDAERAYFDKFVNNDDNRNIVLTHLQQASFTKISIAYSNYFLTFNNTIMQVLVCLSDAVTNSYHQNKVSAFCQYYQCFLDNIAFWIEEQRLEMSSYNKDNIARNSRLLRTEWTNSINNGISALNYIMWNMHKRLSFSLLHIVPYYRMKQIQKQFKRKYGHANQ